MLLVLCSGSHHKPGRNDREQQHSAGAGLGSHQQHDCAGHCPGAVLADKLLQPMCVASCICCLPQANRTVLPAYACEGGYMHLLDGTDMLTCK